MKADKEKSKTKIKICGITRCEEAGYLNACGADYAGFVFYPPSRRNISLEKAKEIMTFLDPGIGRAAVTVSPDLSLAGRIQEAGFDLIQIHKSLDPAILKELHIPVWYAFNVSRPEEIERQEAFLTSLPPELGRRIEGIVVDGASYGSGKTFDWERKQNRWLESPVFKNRQFILAGGLTAENVALGIELFGPDIVDVSSGVEAASEGGFSGKDPEKIKSFCQRVRQA